MSIQALHLTKRFTLGGLPAVHDVSFTAPDGALTALLGPSGSGKTTVLRMLAGLEVPDGGTIVIDDDDCTRVPARERGVGFVFQGYALFHHLSVADNIAFGLAVRRTSRRELAARVDELLDLVQLTDLRDRYPAQLSGGQQQRVAFARALAPWPRLLLLDEPFGALDARVRAELREWLQRLHEETRVTTLLVTHDQEEALELAQHVVLMREGRVEQSGSPAAIYDHPATPFVASFVGGGSVLRGRVERGYARLGEAALPVRAPSGVAEGAAVRAFVRPHDVRLWAPHVSDGQNSSRPCEQAVEAHIMRLIRVGGWVRADLRLASGDTLTVQLGPAELETLVVQAGDRVLVEVRTASVFVEEAAP
ncbi:MAG TPA: TOBE-like domain-containing protein [Polyangia bacterium]|nr:TOBE-like domain-containing protein [Polyangia bacterium]